MIAADLAKQIISGEAGFLYKRHIHRTDDTSNALGFLTAIAFSVTNSMGEAAKEHPYLIVLSSSPSSQTTSSISTVLVLGCDDAKVKAAGEGLKEKLGVKGGGKGPRWSGKFIGVWKDGKESASIEEALKDL